MSLRAWGEYGGGSSDISDVDKGRLLAVFDV